jgi:hypothetical protein
VIHLNRVVDLQQRRAGNLSQLLRALHSNVVLRKQDFDVSSSDVFARSALTGWRVARLYRAHEQAELSGAIADTRAMFEAKGWA